MDQTSCCFWTKLTLASLLGLMFLLNLVISFLASALVGLADYNMAILAHVSTERSPSTTALSDFNCTSTTTVQEERETVPVFYNLFVHNSSDAERVKDLVLDQLNFLLPEHRVFMHSIGFPIDVPMTRLAHHEEGTEIDTLHSLWEYCTIHPTGKVVYMHSKGSFNSMYRNKVLRRFLSAGALSYECLTDIYDTCNVCSSRFSPLPHPHTSGNMWLARCDYISKLIDPALFEDRMEEVTNVRRDVYAGCVGLARYAAEHWVYSHPSNQPCDLHTDSKFTWGYNRAPGPEFHKIMAMAPRFSLETFVTDQCVGVGLSGQGRIQEYRELYNETPPATWWGWNYYNDTQIL